MIQLPTRDILQEYQDQVRLWERTQTVGVVVSSEIDRLIRNVSGADDALDWIVVADNPGRNELSDRMYLSPNGQAGRQARLLLGLDALRQGSRVAVLNKCPAHSNQTEGLRNLLHNNTGLMQQMQEHAADTVFRLHVASPDARVWIMGYHQTYKSGVWKLQYRSTKSGPFFPFFYARLRRNYLKRRPDLAQRVYITPHVADTGGKSHFFTKVDMRPFIMGTVRLDQLLGVFQHARQLLC